jgi:hypothetical protein
MMGIQHCGKTPVNFYLQLLYIDADNQARITGMSAPFETNEEMAAALAKAKCLAEQSKTARFLVDFHRGDGDLLDTVAVDRAGFQAITGTAPRTEEEYQLIDARHWQRQREKRDAKAATKRRHGLALTPDESPFLQELALT